MEGFGLHFNIFNSIIFGGIIQGLVFAIAVFTNKKYRSPATLVLAAFIFSFSLDNAQYLLEDIGLITEEQLYAYWFVPFELLSGPLFLLYGISVIHPKRSLSQANIWFFAPFGIGLLVCSVFKIIYALGFMHGNVFFDMEAVLEFVAIAIDMGVLAYLSLKIFRITKVNPDASPQLHWLKIILIALIVLSLAWLFITVADYFYDTEYWYALYIGMSIFIYWMGHVGVYRFGIDDERKKNHPSSKLKQPESLPEKQKNEHIIALEKILVSERKFLDSTLTLDKVAIALNLSPSHLSRIINAELGISFPDYLNSLRVEEAKLHLSNPDFANYTLVGIGLEAGFNSKTTFNTAFKKTTGITPSQYRSR